VLTNKRTWQDNADEFGAIERGAGGWSMAVLVACSVGTTPGSGKVSLGTFAERAQVTVKTVRNYLEAWPKAIAAGADLPPLADLAPADVGTFPLPTRAFHGATGFANTRTGGANSAPKVGRNPVSLATALEAADPAVIADALARVRPDLVAQLAEIAHDTDAENRDAEVIANGGRTDTPNGGDEPLDGVAALLAALAQAESLTTRACRVLTAQADAIAANDQARARVRSMSLALLDTLDRGRVTV
jgi:hypothetical protein